MSLEKWRREVEVALRVVRDATVLAREIRRQFGQQALLKADWSPVTAADLAVQAFVAHHLHRAFPDDPLVAEENSAMLRAPEARPILQAVLDVLRRAIPDLAPDRVLEAIDRGGGTPGDRFWTLDPIDGTKGFVRGDHYAVALACIVRGRVTVGLLGCPELALTNEAREAVGSVVYAVRNGGTFQTPLTPGGESTPLRVSSCREPRDARILRSFEDAHIALGPFLAIVRLLDTKAAPTLMDSQAKHAMIAAGRADVLLRVPATQNVREKIWDQAAGTILIEEAGGRVTDLSGVSLDFGVGRVLTSNHGVIASNGHLHDAVLRAVRSVMSSTSEGRGQPQRF
jgi:3'(2'), 5'-bisphosphate nucleotidase